MLQNKGLQLLVHSGICAIALCHVPMHPGIIAAAVVLCIAITLGICAAD